MPLQYGQVYESNSFALKAVLKQLQLDHIQILDATDKPEIGFTESKAISLSLWDHQQKNTLRIDLWTKEMPVNEMKRFYIDCLGGLAQSVLTATGDESMSGEINSLCERLAVQVRKSE